MPPLDAWNVSDDWVEPVPNRGAVTSTAKDVTSKTEHHSSSGSSTTSIGSSASVLVTPKVLVKSEEENRKLWETANATTPFELLPTAPGKTIIYKPELKILKRAPASAPVQPTVSAASESTILDRKEKERRYNEARERLFGPSASASAGDPTGTSASSTPTGGMSRSSSSTGIAATGPSNAPQSTPPRGGPNNRGGKRASSRGASGLNTPRSKSPSRGGERSEERVDRSTGVIGGVTKKTGNGWIYTGDASRNSSPSSRLRCPGGERNDSTITANLTGSLMTLNLNGGSFGNPVMPQYTPPPAAPVIGNVWAGGRPGGLMNNTQPWQRPQAGFQPLPQQSNQNFTMNYPQPPQAYYNPQQNFHSYSTNNPGFTPQQHFIPQQAMLPQQQQQQQQQQQSPYQAPHNPHMPFPQLQQPPSSNIYPTHPYQTSMPNSSGPSPLSSSTSLSSVYQQQQPQQRDTYEGAGGGGKVIYLQDPNSFAPRPPPPKGTLNPGFGIGFPGTGTGEGDDQVPIREPRGPDTRGGRGFAGRGGRGGGGG